MYVQRLKVSIHGHLDMDMCRIIDLEMFPDFQASRRMMIVPYHNHTNTTLSIEGTELRL
jgi:hypothetical protein